MSSCIAIIAEKTVPDIIIILRSSLILVEKGYHFESSVYFCGQYGFTWFDCSLEAIYLQKTVPFIYFDIFLLSYVLHQLAFINGGVIPQ